MFLPSQEQCCKKYQKVIAESQQKKKKVLTLVKVEVSHTNIVFETLSKFLSFLVGGGVCSSSKLLTDKQVKLEI